MPASRARTFKLGCVVAVAVSHHRLHRLQLYCRKQRGGEIRRGIRSAGSGLQGACLAVQRARARRAGGTPTYHGRSQEGVQSLEGRRGRHRAPQNCLHLSAEGMQGSPDRDQPSLHAGRHDAPVRAAAAEQARRSRCGAGQAHLGCGLCAVQAVVGLLIHRVLHACGRWVEEHHTSRHGSQA